MFLSCHFVFVLYLAFLVLFGCFKGWTGLFCLRQCGSLSPRFQSID